MSSGGRGFRQASAGDKGDEGGISVRVSLLANVEDAPRSRPDIRVQGPSSNAAPGGGDGAADVFRGVIGHGADDAAGGRIGDVEALPARCVGVLAAACKADRRLGW